MNIWLIALGGAVVGTVIVLAFDWSGFKALIASMAIGGIIGMIIFLFTMNMTALYISLTICIVLGIIWHFIVKLAIGKG